MPSGEASLGHPRRRYGAHQCLTLVTADRNLAGSKQISILWNR
jgi:hypothetical protein